MFDHAQNEYQVFREMPKCVDPPAPRVGTLGCGVIQPTVFTLTHSQAGCNCCPAHKRPQSG